MNHYEMQGFNALAKAKYGHCIYNKNDMYVGKSIELYGEYCDAEAQILEQICHDGDVIVEVGANIGTHTVMLAKKVGNGGKVFAFEPQRIIFQTLCGNLAINSLLNVYAYPYAVGEQNGIVKIPPVDYSTIGNFGGISVNNRSNGEDTNLITLDSFLKLNSLRLLKIDVEGMEKEVLLGAKDLIETFKPVIYIENDRIEKSKELIELLWSFGYELYWDLPPLFNKNNFYKNEKNLIGNYISINMLCVHKSAQTRVQNLSKVTSSDFHPSKGKGK